MEKIIKNSLALVHTIGLKVHLVTIQLFTDS
jgi:hypothetical protein